MLVIAATALGLILGVGAWFVGWCGFPGLIYGEAALTYSDGKPNFYDRTTWWDAVPLATAAVACLLALVLSRRHPGASNEPQQATSPKRTRA